MIAYPNIDPIIFEVGPLAIRWYSISYVAGIILGCLYADWLNRKSPSQKNLKIFDDFMIWAILGIIIGGRLGYVFFYNFNYYADHPLDALQVWHGGMSFHGGFLGVAVASVFFCKKYDVRIWPLFDLLAASAPIGLFFGRLANFINGELYGRASDAPWAMIFPTGGNVTRHPSQLYEAALEGLLLFVILFIISKTTKLRSKPGVLTGIFLCGYGASRFIIENFREPDSHIGFVIGQITTGQLLSLPMILLGSVIVFFAIRKA